MIDRAASGQRGRCSCSPAPASSRRPSRISAGARLPLDRRPETHGSGIHGAHDRGGSAREDVTPRRRALGRPVPRHAGGRSGSLAEHAGRLSHRPRASRRSARRLAWPGGQRRLVEAWRTWSDLAPFDRSPALGGTSPLLRLPDRRGHAQGRPSAALAPSRVRAAITEDTGRQRSPALFEAAEDRASSGEPLALRNLALLELLYGSGLRATELVSLPRGALRVGQPFLILNGKGAEERLVPISGARRGGRRAMARGNRRRRRSGYFPAGRGTSAACASTRSSGHGRRRRNPAGADQPARPAPRVRDASAVGRRRPSRRPVAARACRYRDHANLHARR